jgi:hypothetical protein
LISSHRKYNRGQEVAEIAAADDDDDDNGDLPLATWMHKICRDILSLCDLDAHVITDDDVITAVTQTEEDIATEVKRKETNEPK